ncbi:MAG: hypothetical protein V3U57_09600 [Robiginitomaculum sp.]
MKKYTAILGTAFLALTAFSANASEKADILVVKFRANDCQTCVNMEHNLGTAMTMVASNKVKEVTIDTSNALKWEVSAHAAFDYEIVPQFNKWVGKTGFVAVVDRRSQRTIGCLNDRTDAYKMANFIKSAVGLAHDRAVSSNSGEFRCPATFNVDIK